MRSFLLAIVLVAVAAAAQAQTPTAAYHRTRPGANDWHARGGLNGYGLAPGGFGYGGYGGFYPPYSYSPPIVAGSYYQRPYPYHFDYYRNRWDGASNGVYGDPNDKMIPVADCPCLTPPPVEVVE